MQNTADLQVVLQNWELSCRIGNPDTLAQAGWCHIVAGCICLEFVAQNDRGGDCLTQRVPRGGHLVVLERGEEQQEVRF